MTTDHPSTAQGSRQPTVLYYRRVAAESGTASLDKQAARVTAWLTTHGYQLEPFTDRCTSTRFTRANRDDGALSPTAMPSARPDAAPATGTTAATIQRDLDPATSSRPLRVAIYLRATTDESELRAYIDARPGWEFTGLIYRDQQSATARRRRGLARALAGAKSGKFDVLLVDSLDRLTRSMTAMADILGQLDTARVTLCSATEPFDTSTTSGRLLAQIIGVFAGHQRQDIIARKRAGR